MKVLPLFIGGEPVETPDERRFDNLNPATGLRVSRVCEAGADEVDRAVAAAKAAGRGIWGRLSLSDRLNLLDRVAARVEERFDEFLKAEIKDTGKPVSLARRIDIPRGAANFRIFANLMRAFGTSAFPQDTADGKGALNYTLRRPVGVIGVICPWNLPLLLMTWKVAPALAAGNTLVVKPSEETPSTATLLAEVMNEVGMPPGVFNLVHGFGPGSAGELICQHPDVDAITFTGESRTGAAIMKTVAPTMKAVSFELGGKNPAIIFDDCNLDEAVEGTAKSTFTNTGQVCLCSERVFVQRSIFDTFVDRLAERARNLVLGDPFSEASTTGPLISAAHRDKVLSYYELAREEGAEFVVGGGVPELPAPYDSGFFAEPTILTGLNANARCNREEIFGPVCHVTPFDDEDEVVALANDSEYGLAAALWTENLRRAHRVSARLDVGIVWVNTWFLRDLRTPFGGVKLSGIGREGGIHSLNFYSELKNVCIKL